MMTGGVLGVLGGVNMMRMREVGMMSGLLVVAGFVMLRSFGVVMGGHAMVVSRLAVFMHCLFCHPDVLRPCGGDFRAAASPFASSTPGIEARVTGS
jgi:hypothetical protein